MKSKAILALVVLLSLAPALSFGAEIGDTVIRTADGKLEVTSAMMAPNGCYSAGKTVLGAPPNTLSIENAILITQPSKHSGARDCPLGMEILRFAISTEVPKDTNAIVIYSFDEKTQSVSARAVAIPN